MLKKSKIINLGCRLNIYEGEVIKKHIFNNHLFNLTIINSCAVTSEAEKKVAYEIRKAKKNNPNNKVIVTGCAAQINPKKYNSFKEVDLVIGNKEKLLNNTWEKVNYKDNVQVSDILNETKVVPSSVEKFEGKSRAFIEIQQGCDHRCTFCIIPYGRGNNRSVPAGDIVKRIQTIVDNGYNEIVLTGEKDINKILREKFNRIQNNQNLEKKKYKLLINSKKERNIVSKNSKGDPLKFELVIKVQYEIIFNENLILKKAIEKNNIYNNDSDLFKLEQSEKIIIDNISGNISDKIISSIINLDDN